MYRTIIMIGLMPCSPRDTRCHWCRCSTTRCTAPTRNLRLRDRRGRARGRARGGRKLSRDLKHNGPVDVRSAFLVASEAMHCCLQTASEVKSDNKFEISELNTSSRVCLSLQPSGNLISSNQTTNHEILVLNIMPACSVCTTHAPRSSGRFHRTAASRRTPRSRGSRSTCGPRC